MRSLLDLACKHSYFMFNGSLYHQLDGVAMGSPLGPTLANIFLCHHEACWLKDCPSEFKPMLYRRYVDDTFVVFRKQDHSEKFLKYLNSKHQSLSFTCENEKNKSLPFLDILITRGTTYSTTLYHKPTFTGLLLNFSSFVPLRFKHNLISTLIHRIYNICSTYQTIHTEIEKLCKILTRNGYPLQFTQKITRSCLQKLLKPNIPIIGLTKREFTFLFLLLANTLCAYGIN